jgi:GNAT superfamily N-acetyltransferase
LNPQASLESMFRVEKLARHHAVDAFDCGHAALNGYLKRHALTNQQANASQSYVGLKVETVIGYYTLCVGEAQYDDAPERLRKGLARHPVPFMLLARLAVDSHFQGMGAGAGLLKDAAIRTMHASNIAGIRALVVHAKDDAAYKFYQHFGFIAGFSDPLQLCLLTKDLKALVS